jgi:hypothetical protein
VVIVPNNWAELQHYKDRSPPWIKLHKKLLDNYEYQCLPLASKALAPMLWLIASEHETGHIEADAKKLAFRLRMSEQEAADALKPLIANGFFSEVAQVASKTLARSKRAAMPETEKRREETESLFDRERRLPRAQRGAVPRRQAHHGARMNAAESPSALAADAAAVASYLLPVARRPAREWKAGSVRGEAGNSRCRCA